MYFSKYIDNVKRFFKDDIGDYNPIGCVAATLNNSVLFKTHKSCDETEKYFVCKQSEYLLSVCSPPFFVLPIVDFVPLLIFSICNITNAIKTKQNINLIKTKRIRYKKRMIQSKPKLDKANTHMK
jgi:hypothetical protein